MVSSKEISRLEEEETKSLPIVERIISPEDPHVVNGDIGSPNEKKFLQHHQLQRNHLFSH